ncbi:unnamed protein product [Tilletia controversa]|nr:unnamed protein product [Tilletia controversa]
MTDAPFEGRSLRDAAARKLPARYAESELDDTHSKNSGVDSSSTVKTSLPPSTVSGGVQPIHSRGDSPVAPGPPPGYIPPSGTVKRGASKATAAINMLAFSSKGPSPPLPAQTPSSPPVPVAPGPPRSRPATAAAALSTDPVAGTPDSDGEQPNSSSTEDPEPRKQPTVAPKNKADIAEKSKEIQSDEEPSDSELAIAVGVSKTSIIIPKPGVPFRPTPRPFVAEPEIEGRVRADRDVDFFTRRKVALRIEAHPPERQTVPLEDDTDDQDAFEPASTSKTKSSASKRSTAIAALSDDDLAEKDQDQSEEEVIVDLTGSSPSPATAPPKTVKGKTKVVNSNKQANSISKTVSSNSKKQKGKASSKASTTSRSSAPQTRTAANTPTTPVASSSRVRLSARQSPEKATEKATSTSPEKSAAVGSVTLTPEEALKRARTAWTKAHTEANAKSKCESAGLAYVAPSNPASPFYLYYNEPYLKQNPDPRHDNVGIALDCRCCAEHPYTAWRVLEGTSTSLLKSHVNTKKVQGNLEAAKAKSGITGPIERYLVSTKKESTSATPPLSGMQARQIAVAWVTARDRPISIMEDEEFIEWLPEDRRGLVPHRNTITKDIARTFLGMQDVVRKQLAEVEGAIHLAMDIWTSPNGHSYIGVVGCWQEIGKPVRHVLEMIPITNRHTAQNIATEIARMMKRLGIERKVWFIASDSASVNTAMMKILGDDESLPLIEGEATQIRCMAHVLNLISEAVIRPFNQAVRELKEKGVTEEEDWATDEEIREDFDVEEVDELAGEDDRAFSTNLHPSDAYDEEDDQLIRHALQEKGVAYVGSGDQARPSSSSSGTSPPVLTAELRADSGAVGLQIRQLAWFARKLRYNIPLRVSFQTTCALFKLPTPHSLIRDVATRWNSTFEMIERALALWGYGTPS